MKNIQITRSYSSIETELQPNMDIRTDISFYFFKIMPEPYDFYATSMRNSFINFLLCIKFKCQLTNLHEIIK